MKLQLDTKRASLAVLDELLKNPLPEKLISWAQRQQPPAPQLKDGEKSDIESEQEKDGDAEVLGLLDRLGLGAYQDHVLGMGVECLEDLRYVTTDEFREAGLDGEEVRRLNEALAEGAP